MGWELREELTVANPRVYSWIDGEFLLSNNRIVLVPIGLQSPNWSYLGWVRSVWQDGDLGEEVWSGRSESIPVNRASEFELFAPRNQQFRVSVKLREYAQPVTLQVWESTIFEPAPGEGMGVYSATVNEAGEMVVSQGFESCVRTATGRFTLTLTTPLVSENFPVVATLRTQRGVTTAIEAESSGLNQVLVRVRSGSTNALIDDSGFSVVVPQL